MTIGIQAQTANTWGVAFSHDGRHIISGGGFTDGPAGWFRRWQVRDGREVGTAVSTAAPVYAVAVSKDGRWVLHDDGQVVVVRDATSNEEALRVKGQTGRIVAIDVSADSTKFASISLDGTLRVLSTTTGQGLLPRPLQHRHGVAGVKFSTDGQYVANTLGRDRVRIWDANTGDQVSEINLGRASGGGGFFYGSSPLAWSSDSKRLFVVTSDGMITCLDVSASSTHKLAEWSVPVNSPGICSLATNGKEYIVCCTPNSLSFWDIGSYAQIGSTLELQDQVRSVALSSDDSYLACGRSGGIIVYTLRDILPREIPLDPTCRLPLMKVSKEAFASWIGDNLDAAEVILSKEINSRPCHHAHANRALVRTHFRQWDWAIEDAKKSLIIQSSPLAHIAHAVALLGRGEKTRAFQAFDLAFLGCDANETGFLLLVKAVLLFVSGECEDAITRVNDLIAFVNDSEKYNCLSVLGLMYQKQGNVRRAKQSFDLAQSVSFSHRGYHLVTIALIFGEDFGGLKIDR